MERFVAFQLHFFKFTIKVAHKQEQQYYSELTTFPSSLHSILITGKYYNNT